MLDGGVVGERQIGLSDRQRNDGCLWLDTERRMGHLLNGRIVTHWRLWLDKWRRLLGDAILIITRGGLQVVLRSEVVAGASEVVVAGHVDVVFGGAFAVGQVLLLLLLFFTFGLGSVQQSRNVW